VNEWRPRALAPPVERGDPPDELTPDTFAARLYAMLAPLATQDEDTGWSLLTYMNALGVMFQLVEDWVRDSEQGPGWSLLLDIERCPPEALPWLAQFSGVRIPARVTDVEERRDWILSTDGFKRGTVDALLGAAKSTLTGEKRLVFRERDGAAHGYASSPDYAYVLTVYSYSAETPDPTATLNALLAQKPAAIKLYYSAVTRQDYQQVKNTYATYAAVKSAYRDYDALALNQPG
jgi:hypothetical protein